MSRSQRTAALTVRLGIVAVALVVASYVVWRNSHCCFFYVDVVVVAVVVVGVGALVAVVLNFVCTSSSRVMFGPSNWKEVLRCSVCVDFIYSSSSFFYFHGSISGAH